MRDQGSSRPGACALSDPPFTEGLKIVSASCRLDEVKWSSVSFDDALAESTHCPTPVLSLPGAGSIRIVGQRVQAFIDGFSRFLLRAATVPDPVLGRIRQCFLPADTVNTSTAHEAFVNARIATLLLGFQWPFDPQLLPLPGPPAHTDTDDEVAADWQLVQATFAILVPEYSTEWLTMQILVPQSIPELIDLLDTCRSLACKELFPLLFAVYPQPDPRWVFLVASPEWIHDRAIICLDASRFDDRIFAVAAPVLVNRHMVLDMAGLAWTADAVVLVPGIEGAVDDRTDIFLATGMCVSILRLDSRPEPVVTLDNMLQSPAAWDSDPAPNPPSVVDRYCMVAEGFYRDFLLNPGRAPFYRQDIASLFALPASRLTLSPAQPPVVDACFLGRGCKTVVGVGIQSTHSGAHDAIVCLLDCRPILEGWRRAITDQGWLDVGSLRHAYDLTAPPGFCTGFSHCRAHWRWLYVEQGQVVRLFYHRAISLEEYAADDSSHSPHSDGPPRHDDAVPSGSGGPTPRFSGSAVASNPDGVDHSSSSSANTGSSSSAHTQAVEHTVMWGVGSLQYAFLEGNLLLTSDCLPVLAICLAGTFCLAALLLATVPGSARALDLAVGFSLFQVGAIFHLLIALFVRDQLVAFPLRHSLAPTFRVRGGRGFQPALRPLLLLGLCVHSAGAVMAQPVACDCDPAAVRYLDPHSLSYSEPQPWFRGPSPSSCSFSSEASSVRGSPTPAYPLPRLAKFASGQGI